MRRTRLSALLALLAVLAVVATACSGDDDGSEEATEATGTVLTLAADTVSGPLNLTDEQRASGAVCVLQNRFARNSEVVWRARVFDGQGNELDDTALEGVMVELSDGQTFDMRYGPHPRDNPNDFFWTAAWDIPEDYATGTVDFEIIATHSDGSTGVYRPFNVDPSLLTVTDEVLETIETDS